METAVLTAVAAFHWGIVGAATATVITEAVSAVLSFAAVAWSEVVIRMVWTDLHINLSILRAILVLGIPVGIQPALTDFSNASVQAYINSFHSTSVMAGWSSYLKLDQFSLLPVISIGQATTTFVSQNLGAGKPEHAKKGVRTSIVLGGCIVVAISMGLGCFSRQLVFLFNRDPEVVFYGIRFIWLTLPFRIFYVCNQTFAGALRGAGDSRGPMLIMLFSFVFCRQVYLFTISRLAKNIYTVGLGYPLGWVICAVLSAMASVESCRFPVSKKRPQWPQMRRSIGVSSSRFTLLQYSYDERHGSQPCLLSSQS